MNRDQRYYKAYMQSRVISRRGLFRGLFNGATTAEPSPIASLPPSQPVLSNPCQNTYIYCNSCADFCEQQALLWQPNQPPTVVSERCDGCGECVSRCPAMALDMQA